MGVIDGGRTPLELERYLAGRLDELLGSQDRTPAALQLIESILDSTRELNSERVSAIHFNVGQPVVDWANEHRGVLSQLLPPDRDDVIMWMTLAVAYSNGLIDPDRIEPDIDPSWRYAALHDLVPSLAAEPNDSARSGDSAGSAVTT